MPLLVFNVHQIPVAPFTDCEQEMSEWSIVNRPIPDIVEPSATKQGIEEAVGNIGIAT